MSKADLGREVYSFFLKSVMSETVRKSADREFHAAGPEKEKARSAYQRPLCQLCNIRYMAQTREAIAPEFVGEKTAEILSLFASWWLKICKLKG